MKNIIIFVIAMWAFTSLASTQINGLSCSKKGTDVVWVNGVDWGRHQVTSHIDRIEAETPSNLIDQKKVTYYVSYNFAKGLKNDLLESISQKMALQFNLPIRKAFEASYIALWFGSIPVVQVKELLPEWANENLQGFYDFIDTDSVADLEIYKQNMEDQWGSLIKDTTALKRQISKTLLSGNKLILGSDSQGNLFVADAIRAFNDGEQLIDVETGRAGSYNNFTKVVSHLSVASPINSPILKNKVVLNDRDVINLVFFGSPESNFNLAVNSPDPRDTLDRWISHFVDQTYLNSKGHPASEPTSLNALKEFTLQSFVNTAELLESNCPIADFTYQIDAANKLKVLFDAATSTNTDGLVFKWDFGDGTPVQTVGSKTITHIFPSATQFNVKLTITDSTNTDFGLEAEKQLLVKLKVPMVPYASIYFNYDSSDWSRVNLNSTGSYDLNGEAITVEWKIVNGPTLVGPIVSHYFTTPGVKQFSVKITNESGLFVENQYSITIYNKAPTANVVISKVGYRKLRFDATTSIDPDGTVEKFVWYFSETNGYLYTIQYLTPSLVELTFREEWQGMYTFSAYIYVFDDFNASSNSKTFGGFTVMPTGDIFLPF